MCEGFIGKDTRAGSWFGLHNLGITLGARSVAIADRPVETPEVLRLMSAGCRVLAG